MAERAPQAQPHTPTQAAADAAMGAPAPAPAQPAVESGPAAAAAQPAVAPGGGGPPPPGPPGGHGPTQQPPGGRWGAHIRSFFTAFGSVALFCVAAVAVWLFVYGPPLPLKQAWESATVVDGGQIFVHGPQVYTRERLVNDRYQEDSWLSRMLEKSTDVTFGPTETRDINLESNRQGRVGGGTPEKKEGGSANPNPSAANQTGGGGQGGSTADAANKKALPEISERATYILQAHRAYREQIRTMLIENQLDDRHDLHGNTLYRLRFDATILPSEGSRSAARIEIAIEPPEATKAPPTGGWSEMKEYDNWVKGWQELYDRWRNSLEQRLEEEGTAWMRRYEGGRFSPDEYEALIARLRRNILDTMGRIQDPPDEEKARWNARSRDLSGTICFTAAHNRAVDRLETLRAENQDVFPVAGQPFLPNDADREKADKYRLLFLRGIQDKAPLEQEAAHDVYRRQIKQLLVIRRALAEVSDTSRCDQIFYSNLMLVDSALDRTRAPESGASTTQPSPGLTSPQAQVQMQAPSQAGGRRDAVPQQDVDQLQLRRKLLDSVFWPQIYKVVTGVDEALRPIEDGSPQAPVPSFLLASRFQLAGPNDVTPASLARFARVEPQFGDTRRTFRIVPLVRPVLAALKEKCLPPLGAIVRREGVFTLAQTEANVPDELMKIVLQKAKLKLDSLEQDFKPALSKSDDCTYGNVQIDAPVGLFAFASELSKTQEVYTYAISPSEPDDLIANRIRSRQGRDFRLDTPASDKPGSPPAIGVGSQDNVSQEVQSNTPQRSVFGYGERIPVWDSSTDKHPAQARIGWQVLPIDEQLKVDASGRPFLTPKQISMTALVSLPAWWEKINLTVIRAWVDRHGKVVALPEDKAVAPDRAPIVAGANPAGPGADQKRPTYPIALPTNFETLDASLFANADTGPVLVDWQIPRLEVRPCKSFSVTLLGRRLWRSTVVTLGSDRASRVQVMPNMQGIIATFDPAPRPGNLPYGKNSFPYGNLPQDAEKTYDAPLTVWTSQGSVQLPRLIRFELPPDANAYDQSCKELLPNP